MEDQNWNRIETIVDELLAMPEGERQSHIQETCAGDESLQSEVTLLLQSIVDSEGWLENPTEFKEVFLKGIVYDQNRLPPIRSLVGSRIGSYLIKEQIGEGGMGMVYLAERADGAFDHRVAIKVIRNEKTSDENIRRFKQERTILAELNHPGIAKLFDGGITNDGAPYFVMEYVDGVRIDQYCRQQECSLAERLELFKQVLQAVQHAHENLIIHRDLKPSNILVNTAGEIKILDFGIAKLLSLDQPNGGLTQTDAPILTPKYAAPEQILQSSITTATDIYSLGIVFYQLLTENHPFPMDDLSSFEIEELVLKMAPAKPSSRIAAAKLQRDLRGDLDAIALKAIRKEPEQRYRTANEFLADLEHTQQNLPVTAREDSFQYRMQKIFQRNRSRIITAAGILLLIFGFLGIYTWRVTQQKNRIQLQNERAEEITSFLLSLFKANNPRANVGEDFPVSDIIDRGLERLESRSLSPENRALLLGAISQIQLNTGQLDEAGQTIKQAYRLATDSIQATSASIIDINTVLGSWYGDVGEQDSATMMFNRADSLHHETGTTDSDEYRVNVLNLANIYNQNQDFEQSLALLERIKDTFPDEGPEVLHNKSYLYNNLAAAQMGLGQFNEAMTNYQRSLDLKEQIYDAGNPELGLSYHNIAVSYLRQDLSHAAYDLFSKAYEIRRKAYGPDHQLLGSTLSGLATAANNIGKAAEARKYHKESVRIIKEQHGTDHYRYALALRNYASFLVDVGQFELAEEKLEIGHSSISASFGSDHPLNAYITNIKAKLYGEWDQPEKAEANYQLTYTLFEEHYGPNYNRLARVLNGHAIFKFEQQQFEEAIELLKSSNNILLANDNGHSFTYGKNQYYMGKCQLQMDRMELAQQTLNDAYDRITSIKSDTTPIVQEIRTLLSENY